jgi:hypothetical protein
MKDMQQTAQQQQQMQQQQMQLQMQELQSRSNLSQARAEADRGLAYERIARVEENHAMAQKQIAEANKEDELALLNKVRLLKDLETIDLTHLERLISLSARLKNDERSETKPIEPLRQQEAQIAQGVQPQ